MQESLAKHSQNWIIFTWVSFGVAAVMMALGIYNLEASFSAKGIPPLPPSRMDLYR